MNKIKSIVTNLSLSIKLKEKGFPQKNGLFYWWVSKTGQGSYLKYNDWDGRPLPRYRAVTAEETLKELPNSIFYDGNTFYLNIYINDAFKIISYNTSEGMILYEIKWNEKLYPALARMWLYLYKMGIKKP